MDISSDCFYRMQKFSSAGVSAWVEHQRSEDLSKTLGKEDREKLLGDFKNSDHWFHYLTNPSLSYVFKTKKECVELITGAYSSSISDYGYYTVFLVQKQMFSWDMADLDDQTWFELKDGQFVEIPEPNWAEKTLF